MDNDLSALTNHVLWQSTADGLAVVEQDGSITAVNGPFESLFGFAPNTAVGTHVDALIPDAAQEEHARHRSDFHGAPSVRSMGASRLLEGRRCDGSLFPVNVSLSPAEVGGNAVVVAAIRDLSERVAVEADRAEAERRRSIAEDHDRIGRELHDTVVQHLFALGLRLQGLPGLLDDEHASRVINDSVDTIDSVIAQVRSSIHGLRRGTAEEVGFREQVLAVVSEMDEMLPSTPTVEFGGSHETPPDGAIVANLLPVLREALSNAGRHSGASAVWVKVATGPDVTLEVIDNGSGLPVSIERSGLANIATRAHALGGTFEISQADPTGTHLCWRVPNPHVA